MLKMYLLEYFQPRGLVDDSCEQSYLQEKQVYYPSVVVNRQLEKSHERKEIEKPDLVFLKNFNFRISN